MRQEFKKSMRNYQVRSRLLRVQAFCCRNRLYKHVVAEMGVYVIYCTLFYTFVTYNMSYLSLIRHNLSKYKMCNLIYYVHR